MKKKISIFLAVALLCGMTACDESSKDVADSNVETSVADDSSAVDDSSSADSDTDSSSASEDSSKASSDESSNDSSSTENSGSDASSSAENSKPDGGKISAAGSKTQAMSEKIKNWDKGNVVFTAKVEQDEMASEVVCDSLNGWSYCSMKLGDAMFMTMLNKDSKIYMLDAGSKSYSLMDDEEIDESEFDSVMLNFAEDSAPLATGTVTIEGKKYTYEEFSIEDDEKAEIRYYFDDNDSLKYMSYSTDWEMYCPLSIEFKTSKDETHFQIPSDYKEITSEEMSEIQMQNIMGMLGDIMGGFGDLGDLTE